MNAQATNPHALFVFGVARSGTSYFQNLIASHPDIRMSYEGKILLEAEDLFERLINASDETTFFSVLERVAALDADESQNRWLVETIASQRQELRRLALEKPPYGQFIQSIYMQPDPVACWGNKMLRVELCPQVLRHWPDAKIIILVRDPRAVYASQTRRFGSRLKYSTIYWNAHARWTRENVSDDSSRYLVIRYEDFIADTKNVLAEVFRFVDLYDPEQVDALLAANPPRPASLEKWRSQLSARQVLEIESLCFGEMSELGYVPESASAQKNLGALTRGYETVREYASSIPLDIDWWRRKKILSRIWRVLRNR